MRALRFIFMRQNNPSRCKSKRTGITQMQIKPANRVVVIRYAKEYILTHWIMVDPDGDIDSERGQTGSPSQRTDNIY